MLTKYHAKYYAYDLTKRSSSDSYRKLTNTILDAKVDLNPHQIEAALFAFKSPLARGAILADEVGLGKTIEKAIGPYKKVFLTATPLQNSLLELYGLVSFIDAYSFGDLQSFKVQYSRFNGNDTYGELKERLKPLCKRTLRKLLSSSTYAIAGALQSLMGKLERKLKGLTRVRGEVPPWVDEVLSEVIEDYEAYAEEEDEWEDEEGNVYTEADIEAIRHEIDDLRTFRDLAVSIRENAKGEKLLTALVDYFREEAVIMIATEAAAEGINLQFCSFIINYDMPWNPQRIEQRIGRCHRYGQKFDVVVLNFLNIKNAADVRVYELLEQKFMLFEGVFGASDEVLGAIESGVDFEKKILRIYQTCRTAEEIERAFDDLQSQFQEAITTEMKNTRQKILENFDEEVHEKLKVAREESESLLSIQKQRLFDVTKIILKGYADFEEGGFYLSRVPPGVDASAGRYTLTLNENLGFRYRLGMPLGRYVIDEAKNLPTPPVTIQFFYSGIPRISVLEPYLGASGYLRVNMATVESFDTVDEILLSCVTDAGSPVEPEVAQRLFSLPGEVIDAGQREIPPLVEHIFDRLLSDFRKRLEEADSKFFDEEMIKLDAWAEDLKKSLEWEIKQLDVDIKTRKAEARKIHELAEKVEAQRDIKKLEALRNEKRKKLFTAQDEIEKRKENLIDSIEERMEQKIKVKELFVIRWGLE